MTDDKILKGDDVIDRETPEYMELIAEMRLIVLAADKVIADVRPSVMNERYLTTLDMMRSFGISRRALQNYRDKGMIPYTSIGGVILYPESKIGEGLDKNYYRPTTFGE